MRRSHEQGGRFGNPQDLECLVSDLAWKSIQGGWVRGAGQWAGAIPEGRGAVGYVAKGGCTITSATGRELRLSRGDLALSLSGASLLFRGSSTDSRTPASPDIPPLSMLHEMNGTGASHPEETRLFYLSFDIPQSAAGALPDLVLIPGSRGRSPGPLESALRLLSGEAERPSGGSATVLELGLGVLVIQALRQLGPGEAPAAPAVAAAASDPAISAALAVMHAQPEVSWSVAALASRAGLSRSVFALRFLDVVGETPLAYLLELRMRLAARLLEQDEVHVKEIASRASYGSAAAFGHAFRRWSGESPGRFRARARLGDRPGSR